MKKNLLLVTLRKEISNMYEKELRIIFSDYLNIQTFSLEEKSTNSLKYSYLNNIDIIVITSNEVYSLVRNAIDITIPIVYLSFTFAQDKIDVLKKYPKNTRAYIGFKAFSASYETVYLLYNLGLNNLNIKVYNPKETDINDIDVAIICDDSCIFPDNVNNLLSMGPRKISFTTLMDICSLANILDDNLENIIYDYCKNNAKHNDCFKDIYDKYLNVDVQLHAIVNCMDDSFLMINQDYIIFDYNNQLLNLFNIKKEIKDSKVFDIPNFSVMFNIFLTNEEIKDQLINITQFNKNILVSKKIIKNKNKNNDIYIFIIKDVTELLILEGKMRSQIVKNGYIAKYNFDAIKGESLAIKNCINMAKKISILNKTTLIIGKSGTGKELFAQSIHNYSDRSKYPFIAINCATLPTNLLESELFGYDEGSFTGAKKGGKPGFFEMAHKGTLFLDEIGEMSLETQSKLLRVLEEKEVMRIGGNKIISIDVRIIAATNRNLKEYVDKGLFRLDLFFRLNTITLTIPSLNERKEDIPILINDFLQNENCEYKTISSDVFDFLKKYEWEGNVRELKNCIEYMSAVSDEKINMNHLPSYMIKNNDIYTNDDNDNDNDNININNTESNHAFQNFMVNSKLLGYFTNFYECKIAEDILKIISEKNMGRRSILKELHKKDILISEYMLRSILDILKENNLVWYGKGRSGVFITNEVKNIILSK